MTGPTDSAFYDPWEAPQEPPDGHDEPTTPPRYPEEPDKPTEGTPDGTTAPVRQNGHHPVGHLQTTIDFDAIDGPDHPTPDLPILPADFWHARPLLGLIRQAAHARGVSADTTFYTLLAKLASMVPNTARVDTEQKTPTSLNLMVAVVADSGINKTSSVGVARTLLAANPLIAGYLDGLPLGSGEGLVEAFMGEVEIATDEIKKNGEPKTITTRTQTRYNAFFEMDEGAAMFKILERQGATLGETLRTAWSGGLLGSQNATKDRNRRVTDYCLGLVVGFQKTTALPLLADHVMGTPQRFLWCSAADPTIPGWDDKPEQPRGQIGWDYEVIHQTGLLGCHPEIKRWLWERNRSKNRPGEIEVVAHDSQVEAMLIKLAALLAILDGRTAVELEDWELGKMVWEHSSSVRDQLLKLNEQVRQQEAEARRERDRQRAADDEEGRSEFVDQKVAAAAAVYARIVHQHPEGLAGWKVKDSASSKYKKYAADAFARAVGEGWIVDKGGHWYPGDVAPGDSA